MSALVFIAMAMLACNVGCTPSKYRQQADEDANCLTDQKAALAGIEPASFRIDVDPRSRMYDPSDPDCEPMPPDDPTSNLLMQRVDCKKGSRLWGKLPKTPFVENPAWTDYLPVNEKGEVVLDLTGAVEMGVLNSPRYQNELEQLYLSALDVSFERFQFDSQFFGGSSIFFTTDGERHEGRADAATAGDPTSTLVVGVSDAEAGRLRFSKLYATGTDLVVGFANSLVWQFSGADNYSSTTFLDFSLMQPLLRGAGRTRVLERLTLSERNLLANVREMDRFREAYYVSVVTGQDPGQGPTRRGGVFGSGFTGFTGVGGVGFGGVAVGGGGLGQGGLGQGGGGGNFTGGAGAQGSGGYLGLLQSAQVIRNQYANVAALRDSVLQLEASYDAGRIDRFQVDLARQALFNAQSQLLIAENQYRTFLEFFLTNLGLPPELNVKIEDYLIDDLNLLDPTLEELQKRVSEVLNELRSLREAEEQRAQAGGPQQLVVPNVPENAAEELAVRLAPIMADARRVEAIVTERIAAVEHDFERLDEAMPRRRESLARLATRPELSDANIDPQVFSVERLNVQIEKQRSEFNNLEARLVKSSAALSQLVNTDQPGNRDTLNLLVRTLTELSGQLLELSLAQAGARLEAITLEPTELNNEQALAIAAAFRQDWMNARAALVDSWRLIYFNANDLRSDLNLVFSGDIGNVGDNPFRLRSTRGRLRVGVEFDGALTRMAERNIYRQALIEFQQARRTYYQFRDNVYLDLRNTLRQIRLNELNFELRRAAVQTAIAQVDLTQLRLSEPPQPGETAVFDNTTARDLVQALGDLLNVQNDFLSVWINHEVQQLSLELDLGVMELAPNGLRIENAMPFDAFLVNLPCNTTDMGLAAQGLNLIDPVLPRPEVLEPAWPLPVPGEETPSGPLPVPDEENLPPELPGGAATEDGTTHATALQAAESSGGSRETSQRDQILTNSTRWEDGQAHLIPVVIPPPTESEFLEGNPQPIAQE